ncbi:DUF58 domain-containing protein [Verrucomicrobiota bacterium]
MPDPSKEGIAHFLMPEELNKLSRLVLLSRYVVEGNLAGAHRSPQKGASTEFADHRQYIKGDDPKFIDWKVFGRTDRYYIKRYEDETNLRVYLIMDRSNSMAYGSGDITKYDYACHLAAALGYVTVKVRDSVGAFLCSDKIDMKFNAMNTMLHLNNILKRAQHNPPGSTTALAKNLHMVAESIGKRALIIILSDLFDDPEDVDLAFAHFRKMNHDVIVFHILDPKEIDLSFKGNCEFQDMETEETIAIDARAMAKDYQEIFQEFLQTHRSACAAMNIDYRIVKTDESPETFIRAYLEERRRLSK